MRKRKGKVAKVLGEFSKGKLRSGSKTGPPVKSRKQAVAIGLSEARKAGESAAPKKKRRGNPAASMSTENFERKYGDQPL